MNTPKSVDALKAELADAKAAYEHCSYHDNYQRMRQCQSNAQRQIDRLTAAIAEAEKP
ncbi:hypothetical protein [Mesorhizobium sp. M1B.F.Ca.ET.045.04.1.1]|uniref:hypothetical protein n=1 Tax=Mesorhizobium sp. M1B.F.Ca.ET.045.04.1.1 TaxID=2493673 RepID=UPI001677406E|nr:hypothetical protein [Mesorhizobium sp. M1B.F.Ca.ET.045.04.1.1]